jgi:2-polyprenyl-3-methyl-5-hydroxy-6-metoxy-1,4-benzoquinol methylase
VGLPKIVLDYAYRKRILAKRAIAMLDRVLPSAWGRRLRGWAELLAFRVVPQYQGETLPPIFHYWSERYVRPLLSAHGFESPEDFYLKQLMAEADRTSGRLRILSLGAGGCSLEINLAQTLKASGVAFMFECVDINGGLMQAAGRHAESAGVADAMRFTTSDCNSVLGERGDDVIIVNQFFHHVEDLEVMAAGIARSLAPTGMLLTSDIVGRNGHLLWPSIEKVVQERWTRLSKRQRFDRFTNKALDRYRPENHAAYSNEGVRAQDIIRVLSDHLDFELFLTYAGTIVPFVERRIGFNFDPTSEADRAFIDSVADADRNAIARGDYPGTNMVAVLRRRGAATAAVFDPVSPADHIAMITREVEVCLRSRS